jgi:hypothetical protein
MLLAAFSLRVLNAPFPEEFAGPSQLLQEF